MATGFPAVVPGAGVGEDAWLANWWGRGREVGGGGEPFVREGEDAGAEGFAYQVWEKQCQ